MTDGDAFSDLGWDEDLGQKKKKLDRQISTGSGEIDKKMGGGIPAGSLTLVDGQPDAGKSVLAQQMIWGSLQNGFSTSLFTTENTVKSLVRQMDSLGLGILDPLLLDQFRIFPVRLMEARKNLKKALSKLLVNIQREQDRDLIVVDSLTPFVTHMSVDAGISFFERCKVMCNSGKTIILTIHNYACEEGTFLRLSSMCDAHLKLRIEEMGDKLVKSMEVSKVRGASKTTGNIVAFEIEPNLGMRIIPLSKAKA